MTRVVHLSSLLLVATLSPALQQVSCDRSGDSRLTTLEVEAAGRNRVVGFQPGTSSYNVWTTAGVSSILVRAISAAGGAQVSYTLNTDPLESGSLGLGGGEVVLTIPPDTPIQLTLSVADGGAFRSYQVSINPLCGSIQCDDADACTTNVCGAGSRCVFDAADDGDLCSLDDGAAGWCIQGSCQISSLCPAGKCVDLKECTQDSCDPADGTCSFVPYADFRECGSGAGICIDDDCITAGNECLRAGYGRINCCEVEGCFTGASTCSQPLPPESECDPTGREPPALLTAYPNRSQAGHCTMDGECVWDADHPEAGVCGGVSCVTDDIDCTAQWCDLQNGCQERNLTGVYPCAPLNGTCVGSDCLGSQTACCYVAIPGNSERTPCCPTLLPNDPLNRSGCMVPPDTFDCLDPGVCAVDDEKGSPCNVDTSFLEQGEPGDGLCSLIPTTADPTLFDAKCIPTACAIEDPNDPANYIEVECPDDGLECTEDTCDPNTGACVHTPLPELTPCNGGSGVCLVGGVCADIPPPCNLADATCHACTLQGALDAIAAGGGPHRFSCTGPQVVTITGTLDILNDVILDGGGLLTIEGNNTDLLFQVSSGVTAELRAMTLSRGISATGGPGAIVNDGTLTLTDMTVADSESSGSFGGPVHNTGSLTVVRSVFVGNTGNNGSGALTNVGTVDVVNSQFFNNSTTGDPADYFSQGGALWNSGNATVTNTTMDGNNGEHGGGGIYNTGTLALSGSTVSSNSAPLGLGGGIQNASPGGLTMVDCEIDDNTAVDQGGGIYHDGVILDMLGGSVSGNVVSDPGVATGWGGGIAAQGSDVTLTDVRIADNQAIGDDARGGGIHTSQPGSLTLVDSMVIGNSAVGLRSDGGGVFFDGGLSSPLAITLTTVWGNYSTRFGGGLYTLGASATIVDSVIASNVSEDDGGGIRSSTDGLSILRTTVSGNSSGDKGGGISSQGAFLSLTDSDVSDNVAVDDGGGIAVGDGLLLERTTVQMNSAGGEGGGIHVGAAGDVSVTDASALTGNTAGGSGGGIRVFRGALVVRDSTVDGNLSGAIGGGVSSYGDTSGATDVTIERSTVSGNTANGYGGGIESQWTSNTLTVDESAIIGNASTTAGGGGIYAQDGATAFIVNSTIAQNTANVGGGGLRVNDPSTFVSLTHTTFAENTTGTSGESIALISGQVNIQNSLLFMNTCNTGLTSQGGNLEAGANTCGLTGVDDAIVPPAGVNLSALGLNGGPTLNYLPGPGSSAIDFSPCVVDVTTEQRGIYSRPQGLSCDCGAVEAP